MICKNKLKSLSNAQGAIATKFADSRWVLDARGALYWPIHDVLIVSDLHFEKASYLNNQGYVLPELDSLDTLLLLQSLIDDYQPKQVICLGDSFHDQYSFDRMPRTIVAQLKKMIEGVEQWTWILGNHDQDVHWSLPGDKQVSILLDDIEFLHQPTSKEQKQIVGHYHPKLAYSGHRQKITGKCFVHSSNLLIMPSLGSFTGGLWVDDTAITDWVGENAQHYLITSEKIFAISLSS